MVHGEVAYPMEEPEPGSRPLIGDGTPRRLMPTAVCRAIR